MTNNIMKEARLAIRNMKNQSKASIAKGKKTRTKQLELTAGGMK